jgi:hypothetical protein
MLEGFAGGGLELRKRASGALSLQGSFPYGKRAVLSDGGRSGRPKKEVIAPKAFAYRINTPSDHGGKKDIHLLSGHDYGKPLASVRSAGLLQTLESALGEIYANAPLGTSIVPFPESPETDMESIARGFRGTRGRVLIRESVNVQAAGGPAPAQDWKASDVTPDLSKAMTRETWAAARSGIEMAFGVLPGLSNPVTTGPLVREAQRHLAQWALMPIAAMIGQEASEKLGQPVKLDVMRPLQAFDAGGRARSLGAIIKALGEAKELGVDPAQALKLVDWGNEV